MNFLKFKEAMAPLVAFSVNQVFTVFPDFEHSNLSRWLIKGYLVRLRRGWLTFPEFGKNIDFLRLMANKIYKPSYLSLQYALAFYGLIPEAVVQFTSVTALKTATFSNDFGHFSYQKVKNSLMFGYKPYIISHPLAGGQAFMLATPEKAILDFLYLNPYYNSKAELAELRFDEGFMVDALDKERLGEFLERFKNLALNKRVKELLKIYD